MPVKKRSSTELFTFLEQKVEQYNRPDFIARDPVCIPHQFKRKQDIEIAGFFAAVLAWGQRVTIINKCKELMNMMDNAPHQFMLHHTASDLRRLTHFKHRTFNATDTLYFVEFLSTYYKKNVSLEDAFIGEGKFSIENALKHFHTLFFSLEDAPQRTQKHIPTPIRKSTCKRLNMYLRWMVRDDGRGVDFGLWKKIKSSDLICPCDLHVDRVARALGLIKREQTDWLTAVELTERLREFDGDDPVKYDFALFGLGIEEDFGRVDKASKTLAVKALPVHHFNR